MDNAKFLAGVAAVFTDIGWFDTSHYVGLYPDTAAYPLGPARHYIDFGIAEKRVPRADSLLPCLRELFSKFFRLNLLPGVEADNTVAFLRWVLIYSRHFEALGGCSERGLAAVSGVFRKTPAFRSVTGFKAPAGLSEREIVVLLICRGEQELVGRVLAEAIQMSGNDRASEVETIRKSGYFDEAFYLAANPDVATAGADPVLHYLEHGATEKRAPSAKFSSEFYLANYPDVAATRVNPLLHFLKYGRAEGRQPLPSLMRPAQRDAARVETPAHPHLTALLAQLVTDRSIKAVSFDFFDTLVERKHPDPHMVFVTMAGHSAVKDTGIRDFKAMRVEAERLARSLKSTEVTLADIYRQLGRLSGLPERETALLAELEKAAELDTLTVRPLGVAMLEHARQRKLKLAITSDFYIGKDFLCEVMRKLKIRHDDIAVFVSAETGDTKHDGRLFDTVARALNVPKKQILHIGDNAVSDYRQPLARGLVAGLVPTSLGLISARSRIDEIVVHGDGSAGPDTAAGTSACPAAHLQAIQLFRRLTDVPQQPTLREAAELGYKILGPVLADFARFIAKIARTQRATQLVFLARDTRLLFDLLSARRHRRETDPELSYLLVSRQCILGATLTRFSALPEIIERHYTRFSFAGMLRERFMLDEEGVAAVFAQHHWLGRAKFARTPGTYAETVELFSEYAEKIFPAIRGVAAARAQAYDRYLQSVFRKDKLPLIVDIGYRGTTQKALSEHFGIDSNAAYFMTWTEIASVAEHGLCAWSYVETGAKLQRRLTSRVSLLELFLSDPNAGSLKYVSEAEGPVFGENPLSLEQRDYLNTVHRYALAYAQDHLDPLPGAHPPNRDEAVLQRFAAILSDPPPGFLQLFQDTRFEDRFGGTSLRLLGPNWD